LGAESVVVKNHFHLPSVNHEDLRTVLRRTQDGAPTNLMTGRKSYSMFVADALLAVRETFFGYEIVVPRSKVVREVPVRPINHLVP